MKMWSYLISKSLGIRKTFPLYMLHTDMRYPWGKVITVMSCYRCNFTAKFSMEEWFPFFLKPASMRTLGAFFLKKKDAYFKRHCMLNCGSIAIESLVCSWSCTATLAVSTRASIFGVLPLLLLQKSRQ